MATNKKKIFITESMSQPGRALLRERDDIEIVEFPNMISARDFEAMLRDQAPVHGVALGGTRFGESELEASKDMKVVTRIGVGFDAVDVPALSRRKIPLMVAGTANSPSVAEQALFMMLTLAKRAAEMHSIVKDGNWGHRLGKLPYDLYHNPATRFVAGFIGSPAMNFVPCRLEDVGGKLHIRLTDRIAFPLPAGRAARYQDVARNEKLLLGLRPEHITEASAHPEPGVESFDALLDVTEPMGMETLIYFTLEGAQICGRVNPNAGARDGGQLRLAVDLNNMHLLNEGTGAVI